MTVAILGGASIVSAAPALRTSSLAMVGGLGFVVVVAAGLLTLGPSLGHDAAPSGPAVPTGPADATLAVIAEGTTFNGQRFGTLTTPGGVVEIDYSGASGHTLAFREPALAGFLLTSSPASTGKVELAPGTYEIYCTVGPARGRGHGGHPRRQRVTIARARYLRSPHRWSGPNTTPDSETLPFCAYSV